MWRRKTRNRWIEIIESNSLDGVYKHKTISNSPSTFEISHQKHSTDSKAYTLHVLQPKIGAILNFRWINKHKQARQIIRGKYHRTATKIESLCVTKSTHLRSVYFNKTSSCRWFSELPLITCNHWRHIAVSVDSEWDNSTNSSLLEAPPVPLLNCAKLEYRNTNGLFDPFYGIRLHANTKWKRNK